MKTKKTWIVFIFLLLSLIFRKTGVPGSGLLMNFAFFLAVIQVFKSGFDVKLYNVFFALFLMLSSLFLQSWILPGLIAVVILISWLVFFSWTYKKMSPNRYLFALSLLMTFIFLSASVFNERKFYNFYRSSYYESYVRSLYTERDGLLADLHIDKNKKIDSEESEIAFRKALHADSLKQKEKALTYYNKCLDLNPDNAEAYHRRGFFKLYKLELDHDVSYSAVKDFNRAIRLQPDFMLAYFHRSLALGYLNLKGRALLDIKKIYETDGSLTEEEFQKKYGVSKESFLKPFYP